MRQSLQFIEFEEVLSICEAHYYKSKKSLNLDMLPKVGFCLRTIENEYGTSISRHMCLYLLKKGEDGSDIWCREL